MFNWCAPRCMTWTSAPQIVLVCAGSKARQPLADPQIVLMCAGSKARQPLADP